MAETDANISFCVCVSEKLVNSATIQSLEGLWLKTWLA